MARIRDTTRVLIDLYPIQAVLYIHPLKVWDRYSSQMFLPHRYTGGDLEPIFQGCDASSIRLGSSRSPLRVRADPMAPWDSVCRGLMQFAEEELRELEHTPEIQAMKQELSQMIIGSHPDLRRLADRHVTPDDIFQARNRLIGSGRIGGDYPRIVALSHPCFAPRSPPGSHPTPSGRWTCWTSRKTISGRCPSWMCWKRWTILIYLPLYPDDPRADFKFRFFESSPNALGRILAGAEKFEAFVKVIDVPLASGNRLAHVMADARKGCALCWLDEARGEPALEGEREGSLMDSDPWTR